MARFVVIPRVASDVLLGTPTKRLRPQERLTRSRDLVVARSDASAVKELERWLTERSDLVPAFCRETYRRTGTTLLDLNEHDPCELLRELDVEVVPDLDLPTSTSVLLGSATAAPDPAGLWHLERIGLTAKRANGTARDGGSVTVAVLDSGVDEAHPDLLGRVDEAVARAANGEFIREAESRDEHGHGTSIAGLIAGTHTGVAPAARIVPMRTTLAQRTSLGELLVGWLPWLLTNPEVDIVNLSLGLRRGAFTDGQLLAIESVFAQLLEVGILPIAAVGNEGAGVASVPAALDAVVAVGASNAHDLVWSSSGSGPGLRAGDPTVPSLLAPGVRVTSTAAGGGYRTWSGSSQAAAVTSGIAAVLLDEAQDLTVNELRHELSARAKPLEAASLERQGRGIIGL